MRLRSIATVVVAIGRRRRPSKAPLSACSKYQSQSCAIVIAVRSLWRCSTGSPPLSAAIRASRAKSRASAGVNTPIAPSLRRRLRPSLFRY